MEESRVRVAPDRQPHPPHTVYQHQPARPTLAGLSSIATALGSEQLTNETSVSHVSGQELPRRSSNARESRAGGVWARPSRRSRWASRPRGAYSSKRV